jgi:hypothetical protein
MERRKTITTDTTEGIDHCAPAATTTCHLTVGPSPLRCTPSRFYRWPRLTLIPNRRAPVNMVFSGAAAGSRRRDTYPLSPPTAGNHGMNASTTVSAPCPTRPRPGIRRTEGRGALVVIMNMGELNAQETAFRVSLREHAQSENGLRQHETALWGDVVCIGRYCFLREGLDGGACV